MLDLSLKEQLRGIFAALDGEFLFDANLPPADKHAGELREMLDEVAATSPHLACRFREEAGDLGFDLLKDGQATGIRFRGIPNGHEFSSLLLAVLNADGKGKNIPDEGIRRRVGALRGKISLRTYVSLTCTNCPDVVQALNLMALLNPNIRHEMVDGALFQEEAERFHVQAVPSVFADGELLHVGRSDFGALLEKLEAKYGSETAPAATQAPKAYDLLVLGGGPAGTAAAIYAARKAWKVALVAGRIGGQVQDTLGIENLVSVPHTTGAELAQNLRKHLEAYAVDLYEHRTIARLEVTGEGKVLHLTGGERFRAPSVIIATGASWRRLGVPGEEEHIGRGVAFCPHCDGPFYKGKHVAVVGGGNSGIEAAIDLAALCSKVTVLEFADELKADGLLLEKARALPNVEIFAASQTTEVLGPAEKVTGLRVKDRHSGEERVLPLDGVFVQIGLLPNSAPFKDLLAINRRGEIETDAYCRSSQPGIYAAGDVSSVPFKQIVIAMGEGAKAALAAFEDRLREK
ncbi:MAG: alkyl hydroperoxide reductase subunit F [Tannerella sp.]|jgi:alkyl hydroperoxide reductase subunit F|nr:alkyl hydroperoxide reductase subunit F [Tannerella sp.]